MGKLLIINGSPRAPKSNSKKYGDILRKYWGEGIDVYSVISQKHEEVCKELGKYGDIVFVFPLYVDSLPAVLTNFMKQLEKIAARKENDLLKNLKVHILINCGFLEPEQNDTAIEIFQYFCAKNHLNYGMTLKIASGEAILTTPFAFLVKRKIKRFVKDIRAGKSRTLDISMPLTKKVFLGASTKYWLRYGEKFHTTEKQMRTMKIEDE
ncbi:hypothetical protein H8S37_10265 [Mediterraneibacter sp. NSJ-55]|uniref:NAD(P)H-dependent oxidoreductase n=1 Tax=Mediterraneibacter hominis TaxID=2763054 RepID=A0A923LJB7_9FIRM|nr:hypothetical protein [Mediterraneibacter hominis]MBC5689299.1 hypothetical protein [Mediterraneibacter hominis]